MKTVARSKLFAFGLCAITTISFVVWQAPAAGHEPKNEQQRRTNSTINDSTVPTTTTELNILDWFTDTTEEVLTLPE